MPAPTTITFESAVAYLQGWVEQAVTMPSEQAEAYLRRALAVSGYRVERAS